MLKGRDASQGSVFNAGMEASVLLSHDYKTCSDSEMKEQINLVDRAPLKLSSIALVSRGGCYEKDRCCAEPQMKSGITETGSALNVSRIWHHWIHLGPVA